MLRVKERIKVYPNRSVAQDLAMREGPADENSFTPFKGLSSVLDEQFVGSSRARFDLRAFIEYSTSGNSEFEPSRVDAKFSVENSILEEAVGDNTCVFLEDFIVDGVESPSVRQYFVMQVVGYKRNSKSPYIENFTKLAYDKINEDGDSTPLKMLIDRDYDDKCEYFDEGGFQEALLKMPFVCRYLWNVSKEMKSNLFSFIFAYLICLHEGNAITITSFRNKRTYRLK